MRPRCTERRLRRLHRSHAATRYERLCLRVKGVPVVTARNRMLALGVIGIDVSWQLAVHVRNSALRRRCRHASRSVRNWTRSGRGHRRRPRCIALLPSRLRRSRPRSWVTSGIGVRRWLEGGRRIGLQIHVSHDTNAVRGRKTLTGATLGYEV